MLGIYGLKWFLKFKWNIIPFKLQTRFNPSMTLKNVLFKLQNHFNPSMTMKNVLFKLQNHFNPSMPRKKFPFKLQFYAYEKFAIETSNICLWKIFHLNFKSIYYEYKVYFLLFTGFSQEAAEGNCTFKDWVSHAWYTGRCLIIIE